MMFFKEPGKNWKLTPFPGDHFGLFFSRPPNLFHRLMQRLILGFKWTRE